MKYLIFSLSMLFLFSCDKTEDTPPSNAVINVFGSTIDLNNRILIHTKTFENHQDRSAVTVQGRFSRNNEKLDKVDFFKVNDHDIPSDNMNRYLEAYGGGFLSAEGLLNANLKIQFKDKDQNFEESFYNTPFPHVVLSQDANAVDRNEPLEISWEASVEQRDPTSERKGAYLAHRGTIGSSGDDMEPLSKHVYKTEILSDLNSFVIPASELQKFPENAEIEIKIGKISNFDTASNIDISLLKSISIVIQLL